VILAARVKAGWISEADLAPEAEEIEEAEETEGETGEGEEQDETKDGGAAS
jgi:hypothetical protein